MGHTQHGLVAGPVPPHTTSHPPESVLSSILDRSSAPHKHLCPRQVLGARMALVAGELLALELPRDDKRLLAIGETDGCFLSGIEAAAGLHVSRRTLRVVDYGRIAATFVDLETETAWRVAPAPGVRTRVAQWGPARAPRFQSMLHGYQRMPTEELLTWTRVALTPPGSVLTGRPHVRIDCAACGEEVINERESWRGDRALCPPCARGEAYYRAQV